MKKMKFKPRVLVVGWGSPRVDDFVARVLDSHGFHADWKGATIKELIPNPVVVSSYDVVYGIYLRSSCLYLIVGKLLGKKTIFHFVGSDAYNLMRASLPKQMFWKCVLRFVDVILYVSKHLEGIVALRGYVLASPITADYFKHLDYRFMPDRDILYYCPGGVRAENIYRLEWIVSYAKSHPEEKITIVGNPTRPAKHHIALANVEVIPFVDPSRMSALYHRHKRLIRMTTQDGSPRMIHEALLCGLKVSFNGQDVEEVPIEREPEHFAMRIRKILQST